MIAPSRRIVVFIMINVFQSCFVVGNGRKVRVASEILRNYAFRMHCTVNAGKSFVIIMHEIKTNSYAFSRYNNTRHDKSLTLNDL